jgi:hypothetical protein
MEVAGVSLITNPAAGISHAALDHAEVVEVGARASEAFCGLVERFVAWLCAEGERAGPDGDRPAGPAGAMRLSDSAATGEAPRGAS